MVTLKGYEFNSEYYVARLKYLRERKKEGYRYVTYFYNDEFLVCVPHRNRLACIRNASIKHAEWNELDSEIVKTQMMIGLSKKIRRQHAEN